MPQRADDAGCELVLKFDKGGMIPDQMADHELAPGSGCGGGHGLGLGQIQRQRFLYIDVTPGSKGPAGKLGMCRRGGRDDHAVKLGLAKERWHRHGLGLEFGGKTVGLCGNGVGDAGKDAELRQIARQVPAPHAASNQSNACHRRLSQKGETAWW